MSLQNKDEREKEENSLAQQMHLLLNMPADKEKEMELINSGYGGEVNRGVLMAHAMLEKAIEKGDVTAFKEIKALMSEEEGTSNVLEKIVCSISRSLKNGEGDCEKAASKENESKVEQVKVGEVREKADKNKKAREKNMKKTLKSAETEPD